MDHTESGRYIAVCGPINRERPPYLRAFEFTAQQHAGGTPMTAEWYFLNRLDAVSFLEFLLPAESFKHFAFWNGQEFEPTGVELCLWGPKAQKPVVW